MAGGGAPTGDKKDMSYYLKCMTGGALACGLTHTIVTPLDLVKCRMQVDKTLYKGTVDGLKTIAAKEGVTGLYTGWAPTFIGYNMQGIGKFGFYEIFKALFSKLQGEEMYKRNQALTWAAASASAEFFADMFLCPFEACKVKMQTTLKKGEFPTSLAPAMAKLKAENAFFKGIYPLWARQIPYTVVKFVFFEKCVQFFYRTIWTKPKESYGKSTQLTITFLSGYTAGVLCAIVSHPADTLVSKVNNLGGNDPFGVAAKKIYADIGFSGLWAGLGVRILMIGTLTGLQWYIYDSFKTLVGLQTTGGK